MTEGGPVTLTRVPDLTGTWWRCRRDEDRIIQLIGRVGSDRFVAHHQREPNCKIYSLTIYTLQGEYRQITKPKNLNN